MSREEYPKQFLSLNSELSLLQETVERASRHVDDILVVTNKDLYYHVRYQLEDIGFGEESILVEPLARNTAPAIALACTHIKDKFGNEDVLILPSDHLVSGDFFDTVASAKNLSRDHIVTFGITPTAPATGYGYIRQDKPQGVGFKVKMFTEKPDLELAQEFIDAGDYLWNSGVFLFNLDLMEEEFEKHLPLIHRYMGSQKDLTENYRDLPSISIDHGVIEKSSMVAVVPFMGKWHDVGSWESIYEVLNKDAGGNAVHGDAITIDTKNSIIFGEERLITTLGLENIAIIDTRDALLVADKSRGEDTREIVENLKRSNRREYREGAKTYKPWGYYTVLETGGRYKVKRLCIYPRKGLSRQVHRHRAEHWIVVTGKAKVTKGDDVIFVKENESIYIPKETSHRLENSGDANLHIIETQTGDYLEEDDIVREDDDFGRV